MRADCPRNMSVKLLINIMWPVKLFFISFTLSHICTTVFHYTTLFRNHMIEQHGFLDNANECMHCEYTQLSHSWVFQTHFHGMCKLQGLANY